MEIKDITKFVIHNLNREDRAVLFKQEFKTFFPGEHVTVFPAITPPNEGKRGCWKSFQAVISFAKKANLPMVLVMEDDVKFITDQARSYFEQVWSNQPLQWDVLMGGIFTGLLQKAVPNTNWHRIGCSSGTQFAVYNSTCYDKILSFDTDQPKLSNMRHFDHFVTDEKTGLRCFVCSPMFASQHATKSDITNNQRALDSIQAKYRRLE